MRNILKELRLTANLTQLDVANRLKIGRTSYTNIELGNKNPSLDLAISIKKLFQYEKDDIFLNQ
ncbi:helix-turn-helix domain-containing protein [Clostridium intestinale]|uniref:helix-turn-helix transcriptional regulator n=1 Tax=Clostridium intestinale TaxID=36845 RepID=UPI0028E3EC27|nr:helix-turn-helix domain-containing protein [Clostridium intestinale]